MSEDIRWKQRFENFDKANHRLQEALAAYSKEPQNQLYAIAVVGAFQFTFELAWKTIKDYLNYAGIDVSLPRDAIKQAFHHQIIKNGELWIHMLETHNLMAHVYQEKLALQCVADIQNRFLQGIQQVYNWLKVRLDQE